MGVVVLGALAAGRTSPPTEGVSEDRLFAIASQLKCPACVGESVADSQSASAVQFREEIRDQMARGRTDDEIVSFFVARYDDVVLTPPASGIGALVWVLPVVGLAVAVAALAATFRRWRGEAGTRRATEAEQARVADALRERQGDRPT
jgi:cytochrome c-type biogenesis protein CcmH/NrfF